MTGKRPNITLLAGIFCLAAGTLGAGLTYRTMRTENLTHARTAELSVPFTDSVATASTRFQPYRAGIYRLYLASPVAGMPGCSPESIARDLSRLDGIIDITVGEPDGRVVFSRSIGPGDAAGLSPEANGWLAVDSLSVPVVPDSSWVLDISYCPGIPFAPSCPWIVFLLPPQEYEIGGLLGEGITRLLVFAGVMLSGFILIVAGGMKRS